MSFEQEDHINNDTESLRREFKERLYTTHCILCNEPSDFAMKQIRLHSHPVPVYVEIVDLDTYDLCDLYFCPTCFQNTIKEACNIAAQHDYTKEGSFDYIFKNIENKYWIRVSVEDAINEMS